MLATRKYSMQKKQKKLKMKTNLLEIDSTVHVDHIVINAYDVSDYDGGPTHT